MSALKNFFKKYKQLLIAIVACLGFLFYIGYEWMQFHLRNAVFSDSPIIVYVEKGQTFEDVFTKLKSTEGIDLSIRYSLLSNIYGQNVEVGRYQFEKGDTEFQIWKRISKGIQAPLNITLQKYRRDFSKIAGYLGSKLLIDSAEIMQVYQDTNFWKLKNIPLQYRQAIFIRNTHEVYWTVSATELFSRFIDEFNKYFANIRTLPKPLNTVYELVTLASIVNEETNQQTEMDTIAALYLNRLRLNMKLEADPTVRFAMDNFGIKRVLTADLKTESDYNTYQKTGLPFGPICNPSPEAIQAVLADIEHKYIFMCANMSTPGFHAFTKTYSEHQRYGAQYRAYLNRKNIKR